MTTSTSLISARTHTLISAAIVVMVLTLISSLLDQIVPLFPMDASLPQWRFEHFGTFISSLPLLLVQAGLILALCAIVENRATTQVIGGLLVLIGVIVVPLVLFFLLDFVEVRRAIPASNRTRFDLVALKTGAFGIVLGLPAIWLGWRALKAGTVEKQPQRKQGDGLVVGR